MCSPRSRSSNDPGSDGLGQLAAAADGTLFVPRFGFDDPTLGGVFRLAPDGTPTQISGLAANVRRVGLAYDDDSGVLYVATYNKDSEGVFVGWIAAVDPVNGGETTIVSGLEKPVGILSLGGKLYVGDQPTRKIYSVDLADPALVLLTDEVVALDQFTASGDDDNFFALAYDETLMTGYVYRVNVNGTFSIAAQGFLGAPWDRVRRSQPHLRLRARRPAHRRCPRVLKRSSRVAGAHRHPARSACGRCTTGDA